MKGSVMKNLFKNSGLKTRPNRLYEVQKGMFEGRVGSKPPPVFPYHTENLLVNASLTCPSSKGKAISSLNTNPSFNNKVLKLTKTATTINRNGKSSDNTLFSRNVDASVFCRSYELSCCHIFFTCLVSDVSAVSC